MNLYLHEIGENKSKERSTFHSFALSSQYRLCQTLLYAHRSFLRPDWASSWVVNKNARQAEREREIQSGLVVGSSADICRYRIYSFNTIHISYLTHGMCGNILICMLSWERKNPQLSLYTSVHSRREEGGREYNKAGLEQCLSAAMVTEPLSGVSTKQVKQDL